MIFGVLFHNGVPLIGTTPDEINYEVNQLVRRGHGDHIIFVPEIEYNLALNESIISESHMVMAFANGTGIYQQASGGNIRVIKLPEDRQTLTFTYNTPAATLLLGVIWHVDFISMIVEGERRRRGLPECLIMSVN